MVTIRITRAELSELAQPLVEPFAISGGTMTERRSLIVILHDDAGHVGYGESPPFQLPFYSEETLAGARDMLARVLLPRIVGREFPSIESLDEALRDGVRGNWFARAGVETAAWDLAAHTRGAGLAELLAEALGVQARRSVDCGVALGIPPERRADVLTKWVYEALERGYARVKIKVAPGWDAAAVAAARRGLAAAPLPLTVDANGAYEWPRDQAALRALDDAGLLYIEQPLHPDEIVGHSQLGKVLRTPVCLDETLRDARAARQIIALGGPKVWNIKVHRVGGLSELCRLYRLAEEYDAQLWAGTMPESGIGSQAALAAASLPRFVYPSDLEPSSRWFGRNGDVIKLAMDKSGRMAVPQQSCARLLDPGRFRALTTLLA
jgi:O-succinylbenzoate synthase